MAQEPSVPDWVKYKGHTFTRTFSVVRSTVNRSSIATVCEEAKCPNRTECWSSGTATFMLMGDTCTRGCRFCAIKTSARPGPLDASEPDNLVKALLDWGELTYIVLTSVDRDDLEDGGSNHLAKCVKLVKGEIPHMNVEILIPDFKGDISSLKNVVNAEPEVIAHNIETVRRLTPKVRDRRAGYDQSLEVLRNVKILDPNILTKSSIMVGLSEKKEEVVETLQDLRDVGVDFITIGQYMRPSLKYLAVREFISLELFQEYKDIAERMGFLYAVSEPLSRSSYMAGELFINNYVNNKKN